MRVLQQKKLYENQRDQLRQQVFNMEQASIATDNLRNTATTVDAMMTANTQLKQQYKSFDINKIESIQDEMEDLMYQANELQEAVARSYSVPDDIDEAELDAELEALGQEMLEEETDASYLDAINTANMPALEPVQPQTEENILNQ